MEIRKQILKEIMPQPQQSKNRILFLDALKILAAYLIVFFHLSYYFLNYGFSGEYYFPNINRLIMSLSAAGVPLFFLINGILIVGKEKSWREILLKIGKILLLVCVWRFLGVPYWYFYTLIVLYVMYIPMLWLWRYNKRVYYGILLLIFLFPFVFNQGVVLINLASLWKTEITECIPASFRVNGAKTMYAVLYFYGGILLKEHRDITISKSILLMITGWGLLTFDCVILTNAQHVMFEGVNGAFPTIGALLLTVGLYYCFSKLRFKAWNILTFYAQGVLPIYLLHMYFVNWINKVHRITNLLEAIVGAILICTLCSFIGKIASKIPFLCFFFRM